MLFLADLHRYCRVAQLHRPLSWSRKARWSPSGMERLTPMFVQVNETRNYSRQRLRGRRRHEAAP